MSILRNDSERDAPLETTQQEKLQQARVQLVKADTNERWFKRVCYGIGVSGVVIPLDLWSDGLIPGDVMVVAAVVAAAVAVFVVTGIVLAGASSWAKAGAVVGIVTGVVVMVWSVAGAEIGSKTGVWAGVGIWTAALLYIHLIQAPRDIATATLTRCVPEKE